MVTVTRSVDNELDEDIAHVLSEAARNTIGVNINRNKRQSKKKKNKPWFGPAGMSIIV
jgi:hypothetical protein